MVDFILGLFLTGLLVRGWLRGFVREILDLVALVIGLWIAFKLSAPLGDFLTHSFGVTPEVARIGAGIALFVLFGVSMSVAAHYLSKMTKLPGLDMVNRVGGAAVAAAWGVAIVLVVVNVVAVLPIPEGWKDKLDESTVAHAIAGPDALPQQLVESLAGDNVLGAVASIQDIFGASRAVVEGDEALTIPPATGEEVRQVRNEATEFVDEINKFRAGLGLGALQPSDAITEVAEEKAVASYTSGMLQKSADCSGALTAVGVRVALCGEAIALAGTALGARDGILDTDSSRDELSKPGFDRTGISVVDGPTGRLVVILLAG